MSQLVAMSKDGVTIGVHEACVADHERVGWIVGGTLSEADEDDDQTGDVLSVGKGPGGKFYVKRGKERVSEGFETEADAGAEKERLEAEG